MSRGCSCRVHALKDDVSELLLIFLKGQALHIVFLFQVFAKMKSGVESSALRVLDGATGCLCPTSQSCTASFADERR